MYAYVLVCSIMRHRSLYKLVFDVEAHRSERFHEVVVEQPLLPPLRPALTEAAWERKKRQEKREREEAEAAVLRAAAQEAMEKALAFHETDWLALEQPTVDWKEIPSHGAL